MPETHTIGSFISTELESVIIKGLLHMVPNGFFTDEERELAKEYAYALQNDTFFLETTETPDSVERPGPTQTDQDTLLFVLRSLQSSGVEFHDDPRIRTVLGQEHIEFETFPEGRYIVRIEPMRTRAETPPPVSTPLLDHPICEMPVPMETVVAPPVAPTIADPGYQIDWTDAPTPDVVVPPADSQEYHALFDRMLAIVEDLAKASETEDAELLSTAERRAKFVMEDLRPKPVLTIHDWRTAVINDETVLGFTDWLAKEKNDG